MRLFEVFRGYVPYLLMVIRTVVDIAGYAPRFAVERRSLHEPFFVGATKRPLLIRDPPEVTRQVFVPFDGVVIIDDNFTPTTLASTTASTATKVPVIGNQTAIRRLPKTGARPFTDTAMLLLVLGGMFVLVSRGLHSRKTSSSATSR